MSDVPITRELVEKYLNYLMDFKPEKPMKKMKKKRTMKGVKKSGTAVLGAKFVGKKLKGK